MPQLCIQCLEAMDTSRSPGRSGQLTDRRCKIFFQKIISVVQSVGNIPVIFFLAFLYVLDEILKNPVEKIFPRHGDQLAESRLGEANFSNLVVSLSNL